MKKIILSAALLFPISSFAQAPTEADITALFAKREALRIEAENLEKIVVLGFMLKTDRIQEAVEAAADAIISIQGLLAEQAAAAKVAEIDRSAMAATIVATRSDLDAVSTRIAASRVAAQQTIDAVTKATTILGLRAAVLPFLKQQAQ